MLSLARTDPTQKLKNLKVKLESVVYESQVASLHQKSLFLLYNILILDLLTENCPPQQHYKKH